MWLLAGQPSSGSRLEGRTACRGFYEPPTIEAFNSGVHDNFMEKSNLKTPLKWSAIAIAVWATFQSVSPTILDKIWPEKKDPKPLVLHWKRIRPSSYPPRDEHVYQVLNTTRKTLDVTVWQIGLNDSLVYTSGTIKKGPDPIHSYTLPSMLSGTSAYISGTSAIEDYPLSFTINDQLLKVLDVPKKYEDPGMFEFVHAGHERKTTRKVREANE
jgi:hypothetical protein